MVDPRLCIRNRLVQNAGVSVKADVIAKGTYSLPAHVAMAIALELLFVPPQARPYVFLWMLRLNVLGR